MEEAPAVEYGTAEKDSGISTEQVRALVEPLNMAELFSDGRPHDGRGGGIGMPDGGRGGMNDYPCPIGGPGFGNGGGQGGGEIRETYTSYEIGPSYLSLEHYSPN